MSFLDLCIVVFCMFEELCEEIVKCIINGGYFGCGVWVVDVQSVMVVLILFEFDEWVNVWMMVGDCVIDEVECVLNFDE